MARDFRFEFFETLTFVLCFGVFFFVFFLLVLNSLTVDVLMLDVFFYSCFSFSTFAPVVDVVFFFSTWASCDLKL